MKTALALVPPSKLTSNPLVNQELETEAVGSDYQARIEDDMAWSLEADFAGDMPNEWDDGDEPAAASTSLDPQQSTVNPLATRPEQAYRFKGKEWAYSRVLATLKEHVRWWPKAKRLEGCGDHATIWHSPSTGAVQVRARHCGMRSCPRCREQHAARTKDILERFTRNTPLTRTSMITLTLRSSSEALPEQVDRLYRHFKALRLTTVWRHARPRGFAVLEITWSDERQQWHPHLHLLADTPYIAKEKLSAAWNKITHGSYIVDIKRVNGKSIEKLHKYLSDYLTKPPTESILGDDDRLAEWLETMEDRKVLIRFGRPELAEEKPQDPQPTDWILVGRYDAIVARAQQGDDDAKQWLIFLQRQRPPESNDIKAGKDYRIDGIFPIFD